MLATTTLMAIGCEAGTGEPLRHASPASADAPGAPSPSGTGTDATAYDPQTPTNQGPTFNADGFAAIAPILDRQCSECHHQGTWLALATGADAETAAKIVSTVTAGTMPPAPRDPVSAADIEKLTTWRDGQVPAAAAATNATATAGPTVTQILDAPTLAKYRAALPKVAWARLAAILQSPSTLFWDKATMPPAYQDTVGDGASLPLGARLNSTGKSLIVPEGKKLFSDDGTTWSFPFGHTAGADASPQILIVNFMSLPVQGGALLPIAYKIESGTTQGLPIKRWNWSFPKGTVLGEIVMMKDGASLVAAELRVRERYATEWATNVFRPFPTAKTLAAAIRQHTPTWASAPNLKATVDALENNSTLTARRLDSPAFGGLVTLEGAVDAPLPAVGDDALVRDLLKATPFVGAYGTTWKTDGTARAYGPTGPASAFSFVPAGFDTGLLEVRESTCHKCHDQGGTFIGDIVDQAVLYGDVWGVDRIFSFHPFEPSLIDASGNENRVVRSALSSIVVPYDAAQHPASLYSFYRPTR
jgi:hypothetical protein